MVEIQFMDHLVFKEAYFSNRIKYLRSKPSNVIEMNIRMKSYATWRIPYKAPLTSFQTFWTPTFQKRKEDQPILTL